MDTKSISCFSSGMTSSLRDESYPILSFWMPHRPRMGTPTTEPSENLIGFKRCCIGLVVESAGSGDNCVGGWQLIRALSLIACPHVEIASTQMLLAVRVLKDKLEIDAGSELSSAKCRTEERRWRSFDNRRKRGQAQLDEIMRRQQ